MDLRKKRQEILRGRGTSVRKERRGERKDEAVKLRTGRSKCASERGGKN